MKPFWAALVLVLSGCATQTPVPDALALLKRDLGEAIEVTSNKEIRYCPDNTCEIYRAGQEEVSLPAFVYLHLYYESGYIYLSQAVGGLTPFRRSAVEEPQVLASVSKYCSGQSPDAKCILNGMRVALKVEECFGRYDEGAYCEVCGEKSVCNKL